MKKYISPNFIFIISIIIVGVFSRLIPHLPNFTPVAAIALFGGTFINKKFLAFIIPFVILLISDILIGFHGYMLSVYVSFAITVTLGFQVRKKVGITSVLTASLISSVLFYVITNVAVWYGSPFFAQDISGLIKCYIVAIPFFNNSMFGDLFFSSIFFSIYILACRRFTILSKVKA